MTDFIECFVKEAAAHATRSIWAHARHFTCSLGTIKATMNSLGLRLFMHRWQHFITNAAKKKHFAHAKKLLNWLKQKNNASTVKVFSDKKIFTVDQFHNCRNDR